MSNSDHPLATPFPDTSDMFNLQHGLLWVGFTETSKEELNNWFDAEMDSEMEGTTRYMTLEEAKDKYSGRVVNIAVSMRFNDIWR